MSSDSPEKSDNYFLQFFQEGNKLDFSGQRLTKVPRNCPRALSRKITRLILDNNELNKFDNLQPFDCAVEFSARHNHVFRMYQMVNLKQLVRLDLSHNSILSIEGLAELLHLSYLNLSHNKIKVIDHLQRNVQLEHLDLSENLITAISNISHLTKLKKLYLHRNSITTLQRCEMYLPCSIETLTLAGNKLADLYEVSFVLGSEHLRDISIESNPCVLMTGNDAGFDYRPYLLNWCPMLKTIDGFEVDEIERLKGEWLFSQGKGRDDYTGCHDRLVQYLVETCPLNDQNLQTEHERKLRLILSKAHHHQSQLRMAENPSTSGLMTQSLDQSLLESFSTQIGGPRRVRVTNSDHQLTRSFHCVPPYSKPEEEPLPASHPTKSAPLPAASKLVPVPEPLISPMVTSNPPLNVLGMRGDVSKADPISASKLQTIKSAAEKKKSKQSLANEREQAAICIQKMWRGYYTRNINPRTVSVIYAIQSKRFKEYIELLTEKMEATQAVVENSHKLQLLQMQVIHALWKKRCRCVSPGSCATAATQTDDNRTPEGAHLRPSTLPIPPQQVSQYADCLVVDAIKDTVGDSAAAHDTVIESTETKTDVGQGDSEL
ncbi:Hypothetical protein NTJ_03562 [Nesidiocoris tenuis]|uniref:Dynein axonemal assembly factor 1 homolog n=1 Tax=Nesidiocoris tenuis TaxID=355587 RepID=A0ABN7AHB1_9HEMI|nr:Hypothetical protein NTJ_03562 [Nesidiocoris tenuis]